MAKTANRSEHLTINGAILAGGKASRMGGMPKGTLRTDGVFSLVERLLMQAARSGVAETVIVANEPHAYAHPAYQVICDKRTDVGPAAGVEAALAHFHGRCDAVLLMPCDLPALSSQELTSLLKAYESSGVPVVSAETADGRKHPLCAVVATHLLDEVSTAIDRGIVRIDDLWSRLGGFGVFFDNCEAFTNLNSPSDVNRWRTKGGSFATQSQAAGSDQQHQSPTGPDAINPRSSIR